MRQMRYGSLAAIVLTAIAAGCASAGESSAPPVPPAGESTMNPALASIVENVLADAARRTGLDPSKIEVESAEAVTWSDGSIGCPQPGMSYTMALVPGYRIKVKAGNELLDYHASQRGHFVLCPAELAVDPLPDQSR